MLSQTEIRTGLKRFYGTDNYYRFGLRSDAVLTDGAKYLADNAECYWLMDVIASYLGEKAVKDEGFLVARLVVREDRSATFTLDDGNGTVLVTQEIEFTTFPLKDAKLYVILGNLWVILLPGEY